MEKRKRISYRQKLILAPMVKIGTLPTRLLALDYGADIVYTEEIVDWRLLRCTRIKNRILDTVDFIDKSDDTLVLRIAKKERGHLALQIGTSDPNRAVRVALMVVNDVDAIDVNMGCPKSFSLKGGMGAALLTQPARIRSILTALVNAVGDRIAVTCKIRILRDLQQTLDLAKLIASTGVDALAVHGRTKDERPNHGNHVDYIKAVVKTVQGLLPVIANGGSSNNRDSVANTHDGIMGFWKESEADSVMVARAAEWNVSVFREGPRDSVKEVIDKYLDYAIQFDCPFVVVKYNVQQTLGGLQETPQGKEFLASSTMFDLCKVFGREKELMRRKELGLEKSTGQDNNARPLARRDPLLEDRMFRRRQLKEIRNSSQVDDLAMATELSERNDSVTVAEMYSPFVRGHHKTDAEIPKTKLLSLLRRRCKNNPGKLHPVYRTWQKDKMFRSLVEVGVPSETEVSVFSGSAWEKNKRYSEQAAAKVALHCLVCEGIDADDEAEPMEGERKRLKMLVAS